MTKVCVIGLGKIGLPLALLLAKANHRVIGVDSNPSILDKIVTNNLSETTAKAEKILIEQFLNRNLFVTGDLSKALSDSEVIFTAIGTGVGPDGTPDLSSLFKLVENVCADPSNVRGKLFIFKSTLPVGTTRKIAGIIQGKTGLKVGDDFSVAFCPERVLGDKALAEMEALPKVIGGLDEKATAKAIEIYKTIGGRIIVVDNPESAELIKLMDNAYRQTMFAFANDFALLAERYDLNAHELIRAANDGYSRNNIPLPSPGVSGYCLTKDPLYLESAFRDIASKRGFPSVWYSARRSNDYMPLHVIELLRHELEATGRSLKDANVMVCGISYKENTDDTRHSHGLEIAQRLRVEGANVFIWDPLVQEPPDDYVVVKDPDEVLEALDSMIFTVRHREFLQLNHEDAIPRMINRMRTPIIIDGWGMYQKLNGRPEVSYVGVGIPRKRKSQDPVLV